MPNRRSFFRKSIFASLELGTFVPAVALSQRPIPSKFVHMVFFWMKDPKDEKSVQNFIEGTRAFVRQIKEVKAYHVGRPAMTDRPVVDNSYTVCLVAHFENKNGHDIYQDHPAHLQYIEKSKDLWEKVQVFDSMMP